MTSQQSSTSFGDSFALSLISRGSSKDTTRLVFSAPVAVTRFSCTALEARSFLRSLSVFDSQGHRRSGLGRAVVTLLARQQLARGWTSYAYVSGENAASVQLFASLVSRSRGEPDGDVSPAIRPHFERVCAAQRLWNEVSSASHCRRVRATGHHVTLLPLPLRFEMASDLCPDVCWKAKSYLEYKCSSHFASYTRGRNPVCCLGKPETFLSTDSYGNSFVLFFTVF